MQTMNFGSVGVKKPRPRRNTGSPGAARDTAAAGGLVADGGEGVARNGKRSPSPRRAQDRVRQKAFFIPLFAGAASGQAPSPRVPARVEPN